MSSWIEEISKEEAKDLKKKVNEHKKDDVFIFKGGEFLQQYAHYAVEHLENKYGKL